MKKLLGHILRIQSETYQCDDMQDFLLEYGKKLGVEVLQDETGNIYMIKGKAETYPCVVAHMDTVHAIYKGEITLLTVDGRVTGFNKDEMEQAGVGGDDKCGIYAALVALRKLPACKAVFFVDEECGCVGSSNCDLEFFKDCRFVLQADRRGSCDWVDDISGPLGSDDFQKAVGGILKKYKFKPCHGMMTDVMQLRDSKVGVSVANISAGYHNPHSQSEWISLRQLNNTVSMILEICHRMRDSFPFIYEAPPRMFGGFHGDFFGQKHLGLPSREKSDWWFRKDRKADIQGPLGAGEEYDGVWYDEEMNIHKPAQPMDDMCSNCMEVLPSANMIQVSEGYYICRECSTEIYGKQK